MESWGIIIASVAGLFIGSAIWVIAVNQANRRSLFAPPICTADGFSPRIAKVTGASEVSGGDWCRAELGPLAWLPFYGFVSAYRCSACERSQPIWRPAFELAVAGYFALAAYRFDAGIDLAEALIFAIPLLVILLVDAWTRLIYTNIIILATVLGMALAFGHGWRTALSAVGSGAGAMIAFGLLFFLAIAIYRNIRTVPFGLGDVYLAGAIGTMTRWPDVIAALFSGILLAGVILFLLLITKRVGRRTAVPYGPFLCLGALLILVTPS